MRMACCITAVQLLVLSLPTRESGGRFWPVSASDQLFNVQPLSAEHHRSSSQASRKHLAINGSVGTRYGMSTITLVPTTNASTTASRQAAHAFCAYL